LVSLSDTRAAICCRETIDCVQASTFELSKLLSGLIVPIAHLASPAVHEAGCRRLAVFCLERDPEKLMPVFRKTMLKQKDRAG
jgi:hypothetical protein